jgi:hypothetical protein
MEDQGMYTLSLQLSEAFSRKSGPAIKRIFFEFAKQNRCTPISILINNDKIDFVFQKLEKAQILRKENPLKNGNIKTKRL